MSGSGLRCSNEGKMTSNQEYQNSQAEGLMQETHICAPAMGFDPLLSRQNTGIGASSAKAFG